MSPRQIIYGRKFQAPMCKVGELVMGYNTTASNDMGVPRAFYGLYIETNENGTGHRVIKLKTKRPVKTPRCIPKPMSQDMIDRINKLGEEEGVVDGI